MTTVSSPTRFRDYTTIPFEVFIGAFTILPIVVLIYFYPALPERVPEYLNLNGDVIVWGGKGLASVFRLPLMAIDLQTLCLLSKYGLWEARVARSVTPTAEYEAALNLQMGLLDWFRALIAVKWAASSLEVIFLTIDRFRVLSTPARLVSWAVAILGVVGAGVYLYRLLKLNKRVKEAKSINVSRQTDTSHLYGGMFYYNPADPSWVSDKSMPNFGNKWVFAFLACLVCLPLLMFWPMLGP